MRGRVDRCKHCTDSGLRLDVYFHVLALDGFYLASHVLHALNGPDLPTLAKLEIAV